jgi:hypothetical protein
MGIKLNRRDFVRATTAAGVAAFPRTLFGKLLDYQISQLPDFLVGAPGLG